MIDWYLFPIHMTNVINHGQRLSTQSFCERCCITLVASCKNHTLDRNSVPLVTTLMVFEWHLRTMIEIKILAPGSPKRSHWWQSSRLDTWILIRSDPWCYQDPKHDACALHDIKIFMHQLMAIDDNINYHSINPALLINNQGLHASDSLNQIHDDQFNQSMVLEHFQDFSFLQ